MSAYNPDKWVVLKITPKKGKTWYRVLGSWYGGYLGSDSWRMNSGITNVEIKDSDYSFFGVSGSVYNCFKEAYGMSGYTSSVLMRLQDDYAHAASILEVMPEDTDWLSLDYGLKEKL